MKLLLAPHFDDEALFAAFVCLREHPLVVFCFDGAPRHGSVEVRSAESLRSMRVLGCDRVVLHATPETLADQLAQFEHVEHVWAPWPEAGGNSEHNLVGDVAAGLWPDRVSFFTTYTDDGRTVEGERVLPQNGWKWRKRQALACYHSQRQLPGMRPHFDRGLDEYVIGGVMANA